jgi:hypothetical protein
MASSGTDTVVTRETAWLRIATDSLPALLVANGGPWGVIQAYWARTPHTQVPQLYVTRSGFEDFHPMSQRYRPQHEIVLHLVWPVRQTSSPLAEQEQQALDTAIDLIIQRVRGPLGDKTHGGAFLSAGQVPDSPPPVVRFGDAETSIDASKALRATITYRVDDLEFNG